MTQSWKSWGRIGQQTYRVVGDPTEGALLVAAAKAGMFHVETNKNYPRENEIPFDSERKRMITVHDVKHPKPEDASPFYDKIGAEWDVIAVKGAPDVVLEFCTHYQTMNDVPRRLTPKKRKEIMPANDDMTEDALRVLGMAYRVVPDVPDDPDEIETERLEKDLVFAGLVGMIDPPREEVKPALEKARRAGIRTVMITGDYPNTARAIAESIGLLKRGRKVATGAELEAMSEKRLSGDRKDRCLCPCLAGAQTAYCGCIAGQPRSGGNDRRRGERCSCDQTGGYRRGNGHNRHGCRQGDRRYGADRR